MPTLQIRNLPDRIYRKLRDSAKRDHRSMAQQATVLLAQALEAPPSPRQHRRLLLEQFARHPILPDAAKLTPPELLIREDRRR
jgi:plasmid stability protein